jgi:putative PIN family toxin of toxin-antitoxin system
VRVILDTNVVLSGFFFGGVPGRILDAWRERRLILVISAPILIEYREAGARLEARYGGAEFETFIGLLVMNSELVDAPGSLPEQVCDAPADDKFLAAALATGTRLVVSGDAALLRASGWNGIVVARPRQILDRLGG